MVELLQVIGSQVNLSDELKDRIRGSFQPVKATKKEVILMEGDTAKYLYFVAEGILHNFYFHEDRQVSSWFYPEGQFVTAWSSFYTQRPGFENIQCLEDCQLYRISYTNYQQLIQDFPAFGNFARMLAEGILVTLDEFSKNWAFLPAKEKYRLLKEHFPQIESRVNLGHIASFLGMTQATLSRIRAERS